MLGKRKLEVLKKNTVSTQKDDGLNVDIRDVLVYIRECLL